MSGNDERSICEAIQNLAFFVTLGNTTAVPERLSRVAKGLHELAARAEAAEADARRYRWLRDFALFEPDDNRVNDFVNRDFASPGEVDAAIDAELAKEAK